MDEKEGKGRPAAVDTGPGDDDEMSAPASLGPVLGGFLVACIRCCWFSEPGITFNDVEAIGGAAEEGCSITCARWIGAGSDTRAVELTRSITPDNAGGLEEEAIDTEGRVSVKLPVCVDDLEPAELVLACSLLNRDILLRGAFSLSPSLANVDGEGSVTERGKAGSDGVEEETAAVVDVMPSRIMRMSQTTAWKKFTYQLANEQFLSPLQDSYP